MPIRPDARRRSQQPSQARHASLSDPLANLSPIEASDVPLCTPPGLVGLRKCDFEIKRLSTLCQSASCVPAPAFAHKIGNAAVTKAALGNWLQCTQSLKLTVVSSAEIHLSTVLKNRISVRLRIPAHRKRVLSINGSIGPGK
jgi:hypothetical protein